MILKTRDGREVELFARMHDFDDIEITEANFVDSDELVSDEIVSELEEDHSDVIFQEAYENAVMAAEYAMEGDR
jgi:hypothetical protein